MSMSEHFNALKETVDPGIFKQWQEVEVEIESFTDLGIVVIINDEYIGLAYGNQVFEDYSVGQELKAYIKLIRPDGKIDVSFQPDKGTLVCTTSDKIIAHLEAAGGQSSFSDKSSPQAIEYEFQVSKRVFKQAIGKLYKEGRIKILAEGIVLTN